MKPGIHPTYHTKTDITCACGAVLETGSTVENLRTEICSQCHPFYTGKKKFIDTGGRVDRFKRLTEKSVATKATLKKKAPKVKAEKAEAPKAAKKTASKK